MVNNKDLDQHLLRYMFNKIRDTEIKNIKTQKTDDKSMVNGIEKFIDKKVREEMRRNED